MVQASALLVAAAFVVAPVLAAPAHPHHHQHGHIAADSAPVESSAVTRRSIDNPDLVDIVAREPNPFSFKKLVGGIARVAKKVAPIALKAAPLLLRRDEEGNLYVRELDEDELAYITARDLNEDELAYLAARDPSLFGKIKNAVSKGVRIADRVVSTAQRLGFRELEDGDLEEREFDPSFELDERDLEDLEELIEREPLRLGRFLKKAKGAVSKGLRVAQKVTSTAQSLGLRELDADEVLEVEARSLNELD